MGSIRWTCNTWFPLLQPFRRSMSRWCSLHSDRLCRCLQRNQNQGGNLVYVFHYHLSYRSMIGRHKLLRFFVVFEFSLLFCLIFRFYIVVMNYTVCHSLD
ncbi:hypothetical protein GIB67_038198 [Kingdonia uniflora]|uniref:Uncharacterized protein n=1 Tax=Kingdonia uniflora TaxID=39325 RepID=A0A7J7NGU6_9MAGN|nr:hypothetical protein GIB67_038198 [Kingdonia uniflora]